MHILIIGGTRFQGKFLIDEILKGDHHVTVFHRGIHALDSHPKISEVLGDRNLLDDLKKIPHKNYDWLIDTCAYFPVQCDQVLNILGQHLEKICFISSAYVYKEFSPDINEDSPLKRSTTMQNLTPENYGALKIMCENIYLKHGLKNTLILRPSIIIGNGDHTGRLLFWMMLSRTSNALIKLSRSINKKISVIDVKDLTGFTSQALSEGLTGIYNINGHTVSINEILAILHRKLSKNEGNVFEVTKIKLEELGIKTSSLPFLENDQNEEFNSRRAGESGLKIRSLESTLHDFINKPMSLNLPGMYDGLIKNLLK
jgi:2'-hydroxyisoflavone reductase